jgi:chorismate-pyruvate lyase
MPIITQSLLPLKVQLTPLYVEWLNYQSSLTEKLEKKTGDAQIDLLAQDWISTGWWDQKFLKLQEKMVFNREIFMKSHGIIYWYARSIIPQSCYHRAPDFFDRLKNESMKNLIFNEPRVQRLHLIHYPINQECLEFHWVKNYLHELEGILWVRFSEFSFQQRDSFYLVEIMLPQLEHLTS